MENKLYVRFENNGSDSRIIKALESLSGNPQNQTGVYMETACAAVCFTNDMKHIHIHAVGQDFDKIHKLGEDYYETGSGESDYLSELAVEMKDLMPNFSDAATAINWEPESRNSYDYGDALMAVKTRLAQYITALSKLRESNVSTPDVQSNLDDMIRNWKTELDYKIQKRMETSK